MDLGWAERTNKSLISPSDKIPNQYHWVGIAAVARGDRPRRGSWLVAHDHIHPLVTTAQILGPKAGAITAWHRIASHRVSGSEYSIQLTTRCMSSGYLESTCSPTRKGNQTNPRSPPYIIQCAPSPVTLPIFGAGRRLWRPAASKTERDPTIKASMPQPWSRVTGSVRFEDFRPGVAPRRRTPSPQLPSLHVERIIK